MNSDSLSSEHWQQLHRSLRDHSDYLFRLKERMQAIGFAADDPLYERVLVAQTAARDLLNLLHQRAYRTYYGSSNSGQ